jgi:hypothetical protein
MKRLLIPLVLLLTACNNPVPPPPPRTDAAVSGSDRLFDTQRRALDKARAVEGQVNAAAEAQHKQLEQTTQP